MNPGNESEKHLSSLIRAKTSVLLLCENPDLLRESADLIPLEQLQVNATLKLSTLEDGIGLEDVLLLELLQWFKCSFFSWVDRPKCPSCGQLAGNKEDVQPNGTEKAWLAQTVEQYFCSTCRTHVRFPRYNHPRKLLETRCGRCGEWANCFYLLCRALGYDARWIFDMNDHVWVEVYSTSKERWLHCDPCENACDRPLLYEVGWKKPISYVVAVSKEEVQDVTWRYTSNFSQVMTRRRRYREGWLVDFVLEYTRTLQLTLAVQRKNELAKRRALELAEFLTEPKACDDDGYGGRTSGSLSWRIARGETLLGAEQKAFVFEPTEGESTSKCLHVRYSSAADKYVRVSDRSSESESWSTCAFEHSNIFRKLEADWKMAYLARTEGSDKATIAWKFNFENSGQVIQTLKARLKCNTWENGSIKWCFSSDGTRSIVRIYEANDVSDLHTVDFKGCRDLTISAELTNGSGTAAWQHTQLFRQEIDSSEFPFDIKICLKEYS